MIVPEKLNPMRKSRERVAIAACIFVAAAAATRDRGRAALDIDSMRVTIQLRIYLVEKSGCAIIKSRLEHSSAYVYSLSLSLSPQESTLSFSFRIIGRMHFRKSRFYSRALYNHYTFIGQNGLRRFCHIYVLQLIRLICREDPIESDVSDNAFIRVASNREDLRVFIIIKCLILHYITRSRVVLFHMHITSLPAVVNPPF